MPLSSCSPRSSNSIPEPATRSLTDLCRRKKYCRNGGMALAHPSGVGLPGVREGHDVPFPRSLGHAVMQGKVRGVRDSRPLGRGWTRLPLVGAKYRHTGDGPRPRAPQRRAPSPLTFREERYVCLTREVLAQRGHSLPPPRLAAARSRLEGSALWGQRMGSSACVDA
jgi:hypothetical protein